MTAAITNQQNQRAQATGVSNDDSVRTPKSQLGQKDFLQLLTVQLQNQDPMSPMSDMDFIASMSSFSSVESMSSLSTNFETFMNSQAMVSQSMLDTFERLSDSMGSNEEFQYQLAAQAFLGKEVTILDPEKGEFSGTVDRVELIEKTHIDGTKEKVLGLVVNDEIFPVDLVTAIGNPGGILSSVGNTISSVVETAADLI